jgi:hypothetical protein
MGRRFRIFFVAVMLTSVGVMAWVLLRPGEAEPVYQGKPLSYWLEGYYPDVPLGSNGPAVTWDGANEAIHAMGTNAVPSLMRKLQRHDSELRLSTERWLIRWHLMKRRNFTGNEDWKAARGLAALGSAASNAVPQLIRMFEREPSAFTQTTVPGILGTIGRPAAAAVPVLLQRGVTHTNALVRANSIYALRTIFPDAKLVVPLFTKCLNDPDPLVRGQAARTLGAYGKDASAAVPQLVQLYRSEPQQPGRNGAPRVSVDGASYDTRWSASPVFGTQSPDVRELARDAFWKIDREAAEKAGVK